MITPDKAILFIDLAKLTDDVEDYLKIVGVETREYNDLWSYLRKREWGEGKVSYPIHVLASPVSDTPSFQDHYCLRDIICDFSHANPFPIHRDALLHQLHEGH